MSSVILNQTIIMLILMLAGVLCAKTGIISQQSNKDLSKFILQAVNPVVIFMSYQTDYKPELARNLLFTFTMSFVSMILSIIIITLIIREKNGRDTAIERFSSIYSNCGFMGIPLVNAMFGSEGVFCLTAYITVFNIFAWTHGIIIISGEKNLKQAVKVLYSPTMIAIFLGIIFFFAQIRLPEIPSKAMEFIASVNTPMAMIVSGVTMASTNISALIRKRSVYIICALKLIFIPFVISLLIILVFPQSIDTKAKFTVIIAASAPPAAMCTLQAVRYGKNSLYASEIFTAGTILSVITLPIITKLTEFLTKTLV
ncbi:MAG: AEC family transporter [Ruminococcus sp.]|nr:AEC family transporter [Ruminococcus sp.]